MDQTMKEETQSNNGHQSEAVTRTSTKPYILNEYEQKIVDLWNAKFPSSEIAKALGKTRNTIVGKVWRLRRRGIEFAHHPIKGENPKPKKVVKSPRVRSTNPIASLTFKNKNDVNQRYKFVPREAVEAKPLNIGFWKLKANSCRYVMNDGMPENFIFCGAPKERGSYCEAHALICYAPPKIPEQKPRNPNGQRSHYR